MSSIPSADPDPNSGAKAGEPTDPLHAELRRLRLAEPAPELRRRTLAAAGDALDARESSGLGSWWRELALAGAALLLFNLSLPTSMPAVPEFPALPSWYAPSVAQIQAATAELAEQLGVDDGLADYLEKKSLTRALAESSARPASRYSNLQDPS